MGSVYDTAVEGAGFWAEEVRFGLGWRSADVGSGSARGFMRLFWGPVRLGGEVGSVEVRFGAEA